MNQLPNISVDGIRPRDPHHVKVALLNGYRIANPIPLARITREERRTDPHHVKVVL